ncbi:MAG: alpha/beta fold hydrolase [Bacteroidia bacterium]|nr:alpha/beta fold hydrolase [Bacteroidia bacterium]
MKNIILLHGALGCASDLATIASEFEKNNLKTHCFSFSGHGKTSYGNAFGIEQFSSELKNYIHINNLSNPSVFGYSMGGYVALHLASKEASMIKNIITLGTKFNWNKQTVEKETAMLNPEIITQKVPAFAKALEYKHGEGWKTLLQKTAALMWEIHTKNFLNDEILKAINTPTLIGLGDKDNMVTLEETYQVYRTLPQANMYMLPGTKHLLETVNVKTLCNLIMPYIDTKS